ncbi:MAG: type I-MYXAN CRISPR-associated protein Cas6/Cmx6 [Blastocatellia bacterium]|nr:type I-MYXAN CRISPR-associated protein Cas6/Cmx6 [Blastocatellia bacterium]
MKSPEKGGAGFYAPRMGRRDRTVSKDSGGYMIYIELRFPVIGNALPSDHGYAMFSIISKLIPEAHGSDWLAVETIPGTTRGDGGLHLGPRARLKMRLPQDRVPLMLKLAGKRLDVSGYGVRLGVPQVFLLKPASSLYARCVTIKKFTEPEPFLDAVARKLDELGIKGEPDIGPRRAFRVANHTIVGFGLKVHDLSDEGSIILQERGIGGRRHMGCGFFVPILKGR